jgi:hypothetical protein
MLLKEYPPQHYCRAREVFFDTYQGAGKKKSSLTIFQDKETAMKY